MPGAEWLRVARGRPGRALVIGAVTLAVLGVVGMVVQALAHRDVDIVVGEVAAPASEPTDGPVIVVEEPPPVDPERGDGGSGAVFGGRPSGLAVPDGGPYGRVLPFHSDVPVPDDLVFVLVIGSDARPGEDVRRARADSIHLIAANPTLRAGTIVGFPRDTYVDVPGHGRRKINQALALGGPQLLARTVRDLTGLPVHYYVLTGFTGLERVVDELGGVHVYVERRMADRFSQAFFEPGWHHFSGREALAFSRNRKDVPAGDFSRSENQGKLILATMQKLRAEVGDLGALRGWLDVLVRHASLDVGGAALERLAVLGRRTDPARVQNVVAPGRVGTAGRQSVVYLTEDAARLFEDLRGDAVIGSASSYPPPSDEPDSTTTTTAITTTTIVTNPTSTTSTSSTTSTTIFVLDPTGD